jgi:hypothetical protein
MSAQPTQGGTGSVAQQLAAAPLAKAASTKKEVSGLPFEVVTFRVPKQSQDFPPNKNGEVSRRIAQAVIAIKGSGVCFTAWVMQMKDSNGNHLGFKANLPHVGFNPVFEGKDNQDNAALEGFRKTIIARYGVWAKAELAKGTDLNPASVSSNRSYEQLDIDIQALAPRLVKKDQATEETQQG